MTHLFASNRKSVALVRVRRRHLHVSRTAFSNPDGLTIRRVLITGRTLDATAHLIAINGSVLLAFRSAFKMQTLAAGPLDFCASRSRRDLDSMPFQGIGRIGLRRRD